MKYQWRHGSRFAGDAQVVGETVEKLREQNGSIVSGMLVAVAEDPSHPLHRYFEWDDTEAARKHRLYEERKLLYSITIVQRPDENALPIRAFISVVTGQNDRAYQSTQVAAQSASALDSGLELLARQVQGVAETIAGLAAFVSPAKARRLDLTRRVLLRAVDRLRKVLSTG